MPPQDPYVPRLTSDGMRGNPYWYSRNPFYQAGYGLPNCTCYAWGRFWEIGDANRIYEHRPELSTGNAEDWYGHSDSYERGQEPSLGAVACWADGPFSGDGHVAIVEEIDPNTGVITCSNSAIVEEIDPNTGVITCSNSAYGDAYFYLTTLSPPDYLPAAGYRFQGFIYNPYSGGGPSAAKKLWLLKRALWHREEELIK